MQALPIIKALDILNNLFPGLSAVLKRAMMGQFMLQGAEKTLHHRMVIAIAIATTTFSLPFLYSM